MLQVVDQFLDYLSGVKRYSAKTTQSYRIDLEQFATYVQDEYGLTNLQDIQHLIIRSWIMMLKKEGLAHSSINRKISGLKSFYKYCMRNKLVLKNPMLKVQTLKKGKRLPHYVPERRVHAMIESPVVEEEDFAPVRDRVVVMLLYTTGMRRSELIMLTDSDIDDSRFEIKVMGKGGKERICPVDQNLLSAIADYRSIRNAHFERLTFESLVVTDSGKRAYPKLIYNIVHRAIRSVDGAEKASPHVLRHTFATHLSSAGAELNAVKDLLGHASLAATQVYTHNSVDRLIKEYRKAHPRGE